MFVFNRNTNKNMNLYTELSVQPVKGGYAVFNLADRLTTQMKFVEAIALQGRLSKIQRFRN